MKEEHNSETVGNHGLHNIRTDEMICLHLPPYSSSAQRKSPPSDTLSLLYSTSVCDAFQELISDDVSTFSFQPN